MTLEVEKVNTKLIRINKQYFKIHRLGDVRVDLYRGF